MRAIILAAGAGTRLRPLTDDCPKCLVEIGSRRLIDFQLDALHAAGVDDIVVVVGCLAEQVRRHCGSAVRYIDNPDYSTTNSIYSLFLAGSELDTDTFLFNCDILFEKSLLQRMLEAGVPNAVAVDGQVQRVEGEMNVVFDAQRQVRAINKKMDPVQAQAQSVQLVKFDAEGAQAVRHEVERLVAERQQNAFPTSAYGPIIDAGRLYAVEAGDLAWGEIDSVEDYQHAVSQVLPRLGTA
jgi:choline kinase